MRVDGGSIAQGRHIWPLHLARETTRPDAIRKEIGSAVQRQQEITAELKLAPASGESPELAQAQRELSGRRNNELMAMGVTMADPVTTSIGPDVSVGSGCRLGGAVTIIGRSRIGDNCVIEPGVYLDDVEIGDQVRIGANSVIINQRVEMATRLAPLTLLDGSADNRNHTQEQP